MKNLNNVAGAGRIKRPSGWLVAACIAAVLPLSSFGQTLEGPAQKPLTSRDGGGTKPNVILTLDESGSMAFQYLPEGSFTVGSGFSPVVFPSYTLLMHPDDPRAGNGGDYVGIVPGDLRNESLFQKQMRSPDLNKLYYNPEVRYQPWINVDGTRMANASFGAVRVDPLNASPTINLGTTWSGTGNNSTKKTPNGVNSGAEWCNSTAETSTAGRNNGCTDTAGRAFNPAIFYRLNKVSGAFQNPNDPASYTIHNLNDGAATYSWGTNIYPSRTDCDAATCTSAAEKQNFANWFQYHRSRLHAAQAGVPEAFQSFNDRLRVGWGDIKKGYTSVDNVSTAIVSQGVRDLTATHKSSLFNWVRSMNVSGGTPLRQAMYGVGRYFERTDNRGPWSDDPATGTTGPHKTCRRAYNVFVTDGYWNDSGAVLTLPTGTSAIGNSDNTKGAVIPPNGYQYLPTRPYLDSYTESLADVAMHFWKRDLRPDLDNKILTTADDPAYWQHMVNFTVGFGVKGKFDPNTDLPNLANGTKAWSPPFDEIDDLWHAAVNSRGQYFSASNASELAGAIRSALNGAVERELKEAGVAAAARVLQDGNRKYIPKYRTGVWSGDVDAYQLDANGQAGAKLWSASEHLPVWSDRQIFTWDAGLTTPAGVAFDWSALSTASRTAMTNGSQLLVNFIRGDRSNEGTTTTTYRQRESILGDIVNSTPVFVKDGTVEPYTKLPSIGSTYGNFLVDKAARLGVLYVGGNDGMLHAFKDSKGVTPATDGTEVFAYVPRAGFASLSNLTDQNYGTINNYHRFFVDGPMSERDAFVRAPGAASASWRNYLVGSMGAGGRAVFALDVTDPSALNASAIRWEISSAEHAELGYITAPLQVGVVPDGTATGKWIAIFGNGYVNDPASKATLFVVGLQDGSVTKLQVTNATNNGLGGVSLKLNSFGQIDSAFAGDQRGNLWKFSWNQSAGRFEVANNGNALFTTPSNQPIVQPPVVTPHAQGDWIVFGTGRLLTNGDADSTQLQGLYGLRLKTTDPVGATATKSNLVSRTIDAFTGADGSPYFDLNGATVDWPTNSTYRGWAIDLTVAGYTGLRISYAPQTIAGKYAFFSLIAPAQNVAECEQATGRGINLIFPIETGLSATLTTTTGGSGGTGGGGIGNGGATLTVGQCILDTNGDGLINNSDRCDVAGYATSADGIDAVLKGSTSTPSCIGNECTQTTRFSIQNTTGGRPLDITEVIPTPSPTSGTAKDRVWRRIVNPPIR
jgi:type IV pilus assembly protein PilY1